MKKYKLHPDVEKLNFDRLKYKLCESSEAEMTKEECNQAEMEYKKFLTLKKIYPDTDLVPNKLLDKFWHAHILDTKSYREDCETVFGFFIDHFPYFGIYGKEDYNNLEKAFEKTKLLYEEHFGDYPIVLNSASRCQDHACHAPTSCACRTAGACK